MSFRVFWSPYAEEAPEQILNEADEKSEIVFSARQIDRYLADRPGAFGESRADTLRIAFVRPLGVQFDVMRDVSTVIVYDVWRIDRK